ncbi:unknown [Clostridium sp. CAG:306]|nr:unknown [Clostridium sp. CAG:306]
MEILSLVAFGGLMYLCFITIPEIMEKRAAQH